MNSSKNTYILAIIDWLTASLSWMIFFFVRKQIVYHLSLEEAIRQTQTKDYFVIFVVVPLFWLLLYFFTGTYINLYKKSRIRTIFSTLIISLLGSVVLFFIFVINDPNVDYSYFYQFLYRFFLVHFLLTVTGRMILLSIAKRQLKTGKMSFKSAIIGSNERAINMLREIQDNPNLVGFRFVGFLTASEDKPNGLSEYLPFLGNIEDAERIINEHQIEEIYIAIETTEHHKLKDIIIALSNSNVIIKMDADSYDIITGVVRSQNLFMSPYVEISPMIMTDYERLIKRTMDIAVSLLSIILLIPLYIIATINVKRSSHGPIIYRQKRMGLHGKEFNILKFRSMYVDSEKKGPQLSSDNDPRVTRWGRTMRKWRIDEIPQFFNILKGDMSLVGPRPERKYFYDILSLNEPSYKLLLKVRPGLTSWGMVKYGYASEVEEMLKRMRYDLLYIRNASILLDFKILILTFVVILQGRGK